MDPKAVINAWNDWPAIKRFTYAVTGGAMVGGVGGAIACFHYDIPVTTRADTYWSVFRKTAKILLRSSLAGAAAAGGFQAVRDLTDDKVGRQTAWGTIAGGFTGGFLFMATRAFPYELTSCSSLPESGTLSGFYLVSTAPTDMRV
jgi:hypothetical protein